MQQRRSRELLIAFLIIIVITFVYLIVVLLRGSIPAAREFFGHSLGVLGLLLMIMTETLYSIRKRSHNSRWGRMSSWLNFHIITGLVGPYLALLHTAWKFNGLAGIVMLLTAIVVLSGFVGRYIYTAVPRTVDGVELESADLEYQIHDAQEELDNWLSTQTETTRALASRLSLGTVDSHTQSEVVWGRYLVDLRYRRQWNKELKKLDPAARQQANQLERMLERRRQLDRQVSSLAAARRMLSVWHAVHIPIGLTLFTAALIHVIAAVYFATLLH